MAERGDDIPPLEDIPNLNMIRNKLYGSEVSHLAADSENDSPDDQDVESISNLGKDHDKNISNNINCDLASGYSDPARLNNVSCNNRSKGDRHKVNNFAGFKSGFLLNKNAEPSKNDKMLNEMKNLAEIHHNKCCDKDMPFIKSKQGSGHNLNMPEVQEAMKSSNILLQNKDAWLTKELVDKIENDEFLSRCLSDPAYIEAIMEMQSDPQAAILRHIHNPTMQRFLRQFMSLMGDHFMTINNEAKSTKSHLSANQNELGKPSNSRDKS